MLSPVRFLSGGWYGGGVGGDIKLRSGSGSVLEFWPEMEFRQVLALSELVRLRAFSFVDNVCAEA